MSDRMHGRPTVFGQVLEELMEDRGVSGTPELAELSEEAGYRLDEDVLQERMYRDPSQRVDGLTGVAEALDLNSGEVIRLACAHVWEQDPPELSS